MQPAQGVEQPPYMERSPLINKGNPKLNSIRSGSQKNAEILISQYR
jgi:hypothetical protein